MRFIYLLTCFSVFLIGCSQSGRRNNHTKTTQGVNISESKENNTRHHTINKSKGKTTIKMEKKNGVYEVPIEINDVKMYFIFDTGAGIVSISETEAIFLFKQGSLTEDDILGSSSFIDATGNISEGTIINLKTVKIGNRTLNNIQASVVHNLEAPLLLGQSVLEEFGKISIDYANNQITLE